MAYLSRSAKEHHTRPAVDPLFRSAALAWAPKVIGVVLTGGLNDGTAGLQAIEAMGGTAVVQDPDEAEDPGMPRSALENCQIDYRSNLADIGPLLLELVMEKSPSPPTASVQSHGAHGRDLLQHEMAQSLGLGDPTDRMHCSNTTMERLPLSSGRC